ncbi:uncharacterized protein LOC118145582 [Callithrix jacchus]
MADKPQETPPEKARPLSCSTAVENDCSLPCHSVKSLCPIVCAADLLSTPVFGVVGLTGQVVLKPGTGSVDPPGASEAGRRSPLSPPSTPPIGSPSQDSRQGWIEAFPTASESAGTVAEHLIRDIIPRFGLPVTIQSDNGPAFISKITAAVSESLGIQLHAAYHPQSSVPTATLPRVNLHHRQSDVIAAPHS